MFKDVLREQQPVVYHILENALKLDKLAHAYLFYGPSGTMKKEAAILLAQSLMCEVDGYACEACATCKRVAHREYADMLYIDGAETSIKKDDIIKLQRNFNKTGLEQKGKKVYILNHAENATPDALNSLLKFLEEPTNDMVAILLVEQIDRVLPTIVSRCQNIPFTALGVQQCFQLVKDDLEELDAYMLSHIVRQKNAILEASESDDYQHAMYLFKGVLERWQKSPNDALLFLQLEGFPSKQKKYGKVALSYLIDMLSIFFHDCMKVEFNIQNDWYRKHARMMQQDVLHNIHILQVLMQTKDILLKSVNLQLLVDQMIYKMKEVIT